jgi:formylglycine-generating enzyme required for sulfatase activity
VQIVVNRHRALYILAIAIVLLPSLACDVIVPGVDDIGPPTNTPAGPPTLTPTPYIITGATPTETPILAQPTATPMPPPPTPAPLPTLEAAKGPALSPMIEIPAGPFIMGSDKGDPDEAPAHKVDLPAYQIDQFEVTNAQFAQFVKETNRQTDAEKAGIGSWRDFAAGKDNHPAVKVSWNDAKAFCEWAGKRLPTEAEWEKAARGDDGRLYPWGNEWDASKANVKESGFRGTTAVGSFAAGASPYGVMDMAGNVWEWTADWYKAYPGSTTQDKFFGEKFRVLRGGGWFDEAPQVRTTNRSSNVETAANDDIGFRCAK